MDVRLSAARIVDEALAGSALETVAGGDDNALPLTPDHAPMLERASGWRPTLRACARKS